MKYVVWGLIIFLAIIHQDVWFWDDPTLVFGFMPVTLLFHAGISLAAGVTWFLATRYCWPDLTDPADDAAAREGGRAA